MGKTSASPSAAPGRSPKHLRKEIAPAALRCRRKFLRDFPAGFRDEWYLAWERDYKVAAASRWQEYLAPPELRALVRAGEYETVASQAVAIEARTNLLFSFEKMALRDAVRSPEGARTFARGLLTWLEGPDDERTFERWCAAVDDLPRRQTRVLTWPIVTVFGFLARPTEHIFLKPNVTRRAAESYGFDFRYSSRPSWSTYESLRAFAEQIRCDIADLRPRDMIDLQSFIWVLGSDEYPDQR